ncbi:MAG TPA: 3-hydroxyacyl-ACP dehydratase FabZ family protein [Planctomycetota bacterium]|nr:3-hydroxyacyl-ACP dehydratase FabZ family protein [Planctomycetota bacterium]
MPTDDLIDPRAYDPDRIELGIDRLRAMNPQRFEMEQLTGILHFDGPKKLIVGTRHVLPDEWWVRGHVPGRPILPAVLMLEAAAQLGNVYLNLAHPGEHGLWGFGGIDGARFRGIVVPGDKIVLAVLARDVRKRFCKFDFQGFVRERRVVEGTVLGMQLG